MIIAIALPSADRTIVYEAADSGKHQSAGSVFRVYMSQTMPCELRRVEMRERDLRESTFVHDIVIFPV
jgi:hypothetical protein